VLKREKKQKRVRAARRLRRGEEGGSDVEKKQMKSSTGDSSRSRSTTERSAGEEA
jgi:hypothetical protein